jgi:hypothetical protein
LEGPFQLAEHAEFIIEAIDVTEGDPMRVENELRTLCRMLRGPAYKGDLAVDKERVQVAAVGNHWLQVSIAPSNGSMQQPAGILNY